MGRPTNGALTLTAPPRGRGNRPTNGGRTPTAPPGLGARPTNGGWAGLLCLVRRISLAALGGPAGRLGLIVGELMGPTVLVSLFAWPAWRLKGRAGEMVISKDEACLRCLHCEVTGCSVTTRVVAGAGDEMTGLTEVTDRVTGEEAFTSGFVALTRILGGVSDWISEVAGWVSGVAGGKTGWVTGGEDGLTCLVCTFSW